MPDDEIRKSPEIPPFQLPEDSPFPESEEETPTDEAPTDEATGESQSPAPLTSGSRFRSYLIAFGMAVLGGLISAFLVITRPTAPPVSETDSADWDEPEMAPDTETEFAELDAHFTPSRIRRIGRPDQVFSRLSNRIAAAATSEQKTAAVLEMVDFLLETDYWRPERERYIMAREYLLALTDLPLEGEDQRLPVAERLLRMAASMKIPFLYTEAERLLRDTSVETVPFSVLLAETDALLAIAEYESAYKKMDALAARVETRPDHVRHILRVARGLRAALEHPKALEALIAHRTLSHTDTLSDALMEELDEWADALSLLSDIELGAEGLMLRAFVAARRGDAEQEIEALQRAIARGASTARPQAYLQLLERLGAEGRDEEHAVLLTSMMIRPELSDQAISALHARLQAPAETHVLRDLLQAARYHIELSSPLNPPRSALLVAAARAAMQQGWMDHVNEYVDMAEKYAFDRRVRADVMLLRSELAELRGDIHHMIHYLNEAITLHPGHPQEADIRFKLLYSLADIRFSEADLVSGVMGAVSRVPHDQRGLDGLLLVAKRLEDLRIYEQAEVYYQRVVLLSSLLNVGETSVQAPLALLGQARCMMGQQREDEADALLRVINTNPRWSDVWHESGPLWSAIAFRNRQPREAIRRWRQTCGPPGGALLPYLFQRLVPDLAEWPQTFVVSAKPRHPPRIPQALVEAAVELALEQVLLQNDYAQLDYLLTLIENDAEWRRALPLNEYRALCLKHLVAREPSERILEWLERHPVSAPDNREQEVPEDVARLKQLIGEVENASLRARSAHLL